MIQKFEGEISSFGSWIDKNVASPISNRLKPLIGEAWRITTTPFKTIDNISTSVEKMSEAWRQRSESFTNEVITDVEKGAGGVATFLSTPIYPLIAGLGVLYFMKK